MRGKDFLGVAKTISVFVGMIIFAYLLMLGISYFQYSFIKKVKKSGFINIPTNSTLNQQAKMLVEEGYISDTLELFSTARQIGVTSLRSGRYELEKGMSFGDMFNKIGSGYQSPVKIIFNNVYDKHSLAGKVTRNIEMDSTQLVEILSNDTLLAKYGLASETSIFTFIPNTYEAYWNISADGLLSLMKREYDRFWANSQRQAKLIELGMSDKEVLCLAAIVDEECTYDSEMPLVAGVFINRLERNIPLQACPTVKYILGDRTIRRILTKDLAIDSPYNTYKYTGLTPTPITIPSIAAIEAVLNYTKSDYIYFCASDELNGKHLFAKTLKEHNYNADRYSRALNRMKIYR